MQRVGLTATLVAAVIGVAPAANLAQRGPTPVPVRLAPDVIALACAPTAAATAPTPALRVTGGQDAAPRRHFAPGDLLTINGGSGTGIEVGQEYYTRRLLTDAPARHPTLTNPSAVHTSGWIKVYAVDTAMSLATVSYACDSIDVGDYLEPFVAPAVPAAQAEAPPPRRSNYARILFGADARRAFAKGEFIVIDQGSDHGVTPGARFVVYHDNQATGNFLYDVGEAVAVDVKPQSSTLRVTVSRSALLAGDYVAIRK